MATTDANGMVFYDTTEPVDELQVLLNGISTATTNALNGTTRTFRVANQAARDALLTSRGASLAAPLQVDRADTGEIERNVTGTIGGWVVQHRNRVANVGWTTPAPMTNGWVATGGGSVKPFQYKIHNDHVYFRGGLTGGASGTSAFAVAALAPQNTQVITLAGLQSSYTLTATDPRAFLSMIGTTDGGVGGVGVYFTPVAGLAYFGCDGISYPLD